MFSQSVTLLNKGADLRLEDISPFYASNFGIHSGLNREQYIQEVIALSNEVISHGLAFLPTVDVTILEKNGEKYCISFDIYLSDGSSITPDEPYWIVKEDGSWRITGNGYTSSWGIYPQTHKWIKEDGSIQVESGIQFVIDDNGNHGLETAIINGPGLPENGIILSKPQGQSHLSLDEAFLDHNLPSHPWDLYVIPDSMIELIPDNAEYYALIYDANQNLIEDRTKRITKRPYLRNLTDNHFPSLTGISSHDLSAVNIGGTFSFSYTKPTAFVTTRMEADLNLRGTGDFASYETPLPLYQDSASIFIDEPQNWIPNNGELSLEAIDDAHREVKLHWMFMPPRIVFHSDISHFNRWSYG